MKGLGKEVSTEGTNALLEHLAVCGIIPEAIDHDSSEEKLYSKYTDAVIAEAFTALDFRSVVLEERGDSADVDVHCDDYSFVADGKAFRLSRTAKNQKDFKVEALDGWRKQHHHALLVSPLFQYPSRSSQIYEQAIRRKVGMVSYNHLAVLIRMRTAGVGFSASASLKRVFTKTAELRASKDAAPYWTAVTAALVETVPDFRRHWREEISRAEKQLQDAVLLETAVLEEEVSRLRGLSKEAAIEALVTARKLPQRIAVIRDAKRTEVFDF
jgi:type II restriction enzyme